MSSIVFATNNQHKLKEVRNLLPHINILTLRDIGCEEELPETGNTIESNAIQKARYVFDKYGLGCFADDTGLEVEALNGRPGVYSARFAGPQADSEANIIKLLSELKGERNRKARFYTVIALQLNGQSILFTGEVKGEITNEKSGQSGFGYDPVFIPEGDSRTFSEMTELEKNNISHRGIAVRKLAAFLKDL